MINCVYIICKLLKEAIIISLIQHFEADFLWKVSHKILNSGLILKTFTHVFVLKHFTTCCALCCQAASVSSSIGDSSTSSSTLRAAADILCWLSAVVSRTRETLDPGIDCSSIILGPSLPNCKEIINNIRIKSRAKKCLNICHLNK